MEQREDLWQLNTFIQENGLPDHNARHDPVYLLEPYLQSPDRETAIRSMPILSLCCLQ